MKTFSLIIRRIFSAFLAICGAWIGYAATLFAIRDSSGLGVDLFSDSGLILTLFYILLMILAATLIMFAVLFFEDI